MQGDLGETEQRLILDIYDTVLDPSKWTDVLDRVAHAVGARGCMIFELDDPLGKGGRLRAPHISSRYKRDAVEEYIKAFTELELEDQEVFARYSARGDGIDLIGDDVLAPTAAELALRPNSAAMREYGISHRAGALLSKDQPDRDRFSVQFSDRHGPLNGAARATLNLLLPHIAKASELARPVSQLVQRAQGLFEAIERLRVGVCMIRNNRQIVVENAEFARQREMVRIFRRTPNGLLEMVSSSDQVWFANLIGDAGAHGKYGARPRKEALAGGDGETGGLAVEVVPLASADAFGEPRVDGFAVYSLDTSQPIPLDMRRVEMALSLTRSEAGLIEYLAEGLTNREFAARRERSVETVNSQVKAILSKTDCANRTQLIRKITNIGADFLTH